MSPLGLNTQIIIKINPYKIKSTAVDLILYGLILMIICVFRPNGLISFIPKDILERKKQR